MSPEQVVDLLVASIENHARKRLPSYVKASWLGAFADLIGHGLKQALVKVIEDITITRIESDTAEIIDEREA